MAREKICYVIMPFSKTENVQKEQWLKIYENLFKPIIEDSKFGYTCVKSESNTGSFTKEIVHNLKNAKTVLADISDFNHNVMWELGVRHALSKRTIMVAREDMVSKIPSDITNYVVIPYSEGITEYKEFKEKIHNIFQKIEDDPDFSDSPVFDSLIDEELIRSSTEKTKILNNLAGLSSELLYNLDFAERIKTKHHGVSIKEGVTIMRMMNKATDYFLSTNYIATNESFLKIMRDIQEDVEIINKRIDLLLLDRRFKEDYGNSEHVIDLCLKIEPKLKDGIKKINKIREGLKKNLFELNESPIIVMDESQKELIETE